MAFTAEGAANGRFLFVIVVEALHDLLEKAKQVWVLIGYSAECSSVEVNHL